jgi:ABC-2 type transport system permease protein
MAVYKRHYESYGGALTKRWSRPFVLTRYATRDLFRSRFFTGFFVLSLVPVLGFAAYIFIANNSLLHEVLSFRSSATLPVEEQFFAIFLGVQTSLAFLLTCWAAPTLVAGDLSNGALPLFLSRPLNRAEYVTGKFAVLAVLLSFMTWIPALILLFLQAGLGPKNWMMPHLWMIGPILWCSWIWIILLSLIALAASAWVKWRILAMASIFGVFLIPAGFGGVLNATLNTNWGNLLNISYMFQEIVWAGFHESYQAGVGAIPRPAVWAMLIAICLFCLRLLHTRLRAFEVVRG